MHFQTGSKKIGNLRREMLNSLPAQNLADVHTRERTRTLSFFFSFFLSLFIYFAEIIFERKHDENSCFGVRGLGLVALE